MPEDKLIPTYVLFECKSMPAVKQYIGRTLRMADGKTQSLIYNYVDLSGVLQASFRTRLYAYQNMGVTISAPEQPKMVVNR